jgi:hypothetical protein
MAILALFGMAVGGAALGVVIAQSGPDYTVIRLDELAAKGRDTRVVAVVNGVQVQRWTIDVAEAASAAGVASLPSGRALAEMSRDEILQDAIDHLLLAQEAEKAGIRVTEDEVTMAINAGIVEPLRSPDTPDEVRAVLEAMLKVSDLSVENVVSDPGIRDTYRRLVLVGRLVNQLSGERKLLLAQARAKAEIQVFPDVLNAAP